MIFIFPHSVSTFTASLRVSVCHKIEFDMCVTKLTFISELNTSNPMNQCKQCYIWNWINVSNVSDGKSKTKVKNERGPLLMYSSEMETRAMSICWNPYFHHFHRCRFFSASVRLAQCQERAYINNNVILAMLPTSNQDICSKTRHIACFPCYEAKKEASEKLISSIQKKMKSAENLWAKERRMCGYFGRSIVSIWHSFIEVF